MAVLKLVFSLLLIEWVLCWDIYKYNSTANPSSIITAGNNARFTILTENVIRMEYSENGKFEDRPSVTIVNRYLPKPEFTVNSTSKSTIIKTKYLTLTYQNGLEFNSTSLIIEGSFPEYNNLRFKYVPSGKGIEHDNSISQNLYGTLGSLDESNGSVPLNCTIQVTSPTCVWGVIGKLGYALIDDSNGKSAMLQGVNDTDWLSCCPYKGNSNKQDYYFFGHGFNYKQALYDYKLLTGTTPLLPRYAYGSWHSRWYDYSDLSIKQIVDIMVSTQIPLDVVVFDSLDLSRFCVIGFLRIYEYIT